MPSPPAEPEVSARHPLESRLVILATGGTIAGWAEDPAHPARYASAQLSVERLVQDAEPLRLLGVGGRLELEQFAQVDSKDMSFELWRTLASRVQDHLAREVVEGIVVTHGTDTLEETAYFLHAVLAVNKPVVLTGAMRAANVADADGPRNLADAVKVADCRRLAGVWVVMGGQVFAAAGLRKGHTTRLDAFTSVDRPGLPCSALIDDESSLAGLRAQSVAAWPRTTAAVDPQALDPTPWPWVEIVVSSAGARPDMVDGLVRAGVRGLVVAGTGHGTVHAGLEPALHRAAHAGVRILIATRVGTGAVEHQRLPWPTSLGLSPAQARVELILELLAADRASQA